MIGHASLVAFYVAIWLCGCVTPQEQKETNASILQIMENPLEYDSKVVRVIAWYRSSPIGISLESDDFERRIPIVSADSEGLHLPPQLRVEKDQLYYKFWEYIGNTYEIPNTGPHGLRVELDGYIRLLKENGKLTDVFNVFGQRPIEIVPLRIRQMKIYP